MTKKRKPHWVYETTIAAGKGIYYEKEMIRSKAFSKLTGAAKHILLELYMRLKIDISKPNKYSRRGREQFFATNNGKLKITYKSINKMFGYSSATISSALKRLAANGFIDIVELGNGTKRQSHKIALITNWKLYGKDGFKSGIPPADKPINGGFEKKKTNKNLKTTSETKAGTTLETKAVQMSKHHKPP